MWLLVFVLLASFLSFLIVYRRKTNSRKTKNGIERPGILMEVPADASRELSRLERGFKYVTDMSIGLIGCKFVLKSKTEIKEDLFKLFVETYWNFAPLLRMNIIEAPSKLDHHFYFKEMKEIPFDQILKWRKLGDHENLQEQVEREICIPFNVDREPLWRVIVFDLKHEINNNEEYPFKKGVVLVVNHTICDGVALIQLYKQIPQILNFYLRSNAESAACATSSLSTLSSNPIPRTERVPVAVEDVVPNIHFPLWFELLGTIGSKILARTKVIPPFNHEFFEKFQPPIWQNPRIEPAPKILTFKLDTETTTKLIRTTKQQKCTFTGTLIAAMSIACAKQMQNGKIWKGSTFRVAIPVDLRRYFLDHRYDNCIANYTSLSPLWLKCSVRPLKKKESEHSFFWSMARQTSREIHRLVRGSETIKAINVVAPFMDNPSFASDMLKKTATHSSGGRIALFSMSNLGIINGPKEIDSAGYQLDDIAFGANEVLGGSIFSNNVATYDGCLMWNMVHAVHVVSDETAAHVFQGLRETLNLFSRMASSVELSSSEH